VSSNAEFLMRTSLDAQRLERDDPARVAEAPLVEYPGSDLACGS
jgi:hypothetical protein